MTVISIILSSILLPIILLLLPSNVLFISICFFLRYSGSLVNISCIFPVLFLRSWIICTIIILNSFSGRLPISTSSSCFPGVLSCSYIWEIILCFFMFFSQINFLWLLFCSGGFRTVVLLAFLSALWWIMLMGGTGNGKNWFLFWWVGSCSVKV